MSDFNSSLPVRTQNNGDVVAFLADHTASSILNTIKTGSTAAVAGDNALVVALSPNTPLPAGAANIGSVNQGTSPWVTKDLADGSVTGGTAGTFSLLAGGIFNTALPTLTNGQQASLQLDSSGRLITTATITSLGYDTNYGTVGATTLRTAAQIGNATGAADFAAGNSTAQTLRVVIASNQVAIPVTQSTSPWVTSDTATNTSGATAATRGMQVMGVFNTTPATLSTGQSGFLQLDSTQNLLVNLKTPLPAGTNVIGSVNQGTSPWVTKDQSDGPVTPGTVAAFSQLAGGQFNTVLPTLTNTQQAALQTDSSGRLLVVASGTSSVTVTNFPTTVDTNYGTVGASTIRTAAQVGNTTGAADFNAGATGAQTLRTVANQGAPNTAANAWPTVLTTGGAVNSATNPIFVSSSDTVGTSIDNYQTSVAVAAAASVNQDYTVTAAKTFYSKQVWATASGKMKIVVAYETAAGSGTFATFWVGFNSTANTNILIPIPTSKTQVTGARIRITITNLDLLAQDVYSTLSGTEQ